MNAAEALGRLKGLHVPAVTTADAAAVLGLSGTAAGHMLRRLSKAGLVNAFRKGVWAFTEQPDALAMAEYATSPYPAYVSLQSALYQRGLIEQIPTMTYLFSLARTARVKTSAGTSSAVAVPLLAVQPGVFFDAGSGFGTILTSGTGSLTQVNPVPRGGYIEVYATGLGPLRPAFAAAPTTANSVKSTIAGVEADVLFSGQAPGFPGLDQVNVRVPDSVPAGDQLLVLTVNGISSNPAKIRVR